MQMDNPEDDICLKTLDQWLMTTKNRNYNEIIKSPNNDSNVLLEYENVLDNLATKLISAINKEDANMLSKLEWPNELMECIRDSNIKMLMIDKIELWFQQFPHTRNGIQIEELKQDNLTQ